MLDASFLTTTFMSTGQFLRLVHPFPVAQRCAEFFLAHNLFPQHCSPSATVLAQELRHARFRSFSRLPSLIGCYRIARCERAKNYPAVCPAHLLDRLHHVEAGDDGSETDVHPLRLAHVLERQDKTRCGGVLPSPKHRQVAVLLGVLQVLQRWEYVRWRLRSIMM